MDLTKEWDFIVSETHKEKPNNLNLIRREMLFLLQILLSRTELVVYSKLKALYEGAYV